MMMRSKSVRFTGYPRFVLAFFGAATINICCVEAQDAQPYTTQIRSISEPSAVERYRSFNVAKAAHAPQRHSLDGAIVEGSVGKQQEAVTSEVKLAQFQLPAPSSSSASGGDFLNPGNGSATLDSAEQSPTFPFSAGESIKENNQEAFDQSQDPVESGDQLRSLPLGFGSDTRERDKTRLDIDPQPNASDGYAPFESPNLGNNYATMNNSTFVSAPSGYQAAYPWGRNCISANATTVGASARPIPSSTGASVGVVRVLSREVLSNYSAVPTRPILSFGQQENGVVVGQGILGQPVAYVPGQWVRNSIRYLFP